jgi:hypothetical protein
MGAKQWVKKMARPVTRRVYARIDHHIEVQVGPIRARAEAIPNLANDVATLYQDMNRSLPIVLQALSNQNAIERVQRRDLERCLEELGALSRRLEDVERATGTGI